MEDRKQTVNRRDFVKATVAAATLTIIPRHVLGAEGKPATRAP